MERFNDMMQETLLDTMTFKNLHEKGVKLQKDAELRKKEALKLRLLYNISLFNNSYYFHYAII